MINTIDGDRVRHDLVRVFLAACALTLLMAAPVAWSPRTTLFGHEIVGRHHTPFTVIHQFENPQPPGHYTQPATDYPGAALAWVFGDGVPAFNLMVLASFPLAAMFAFLLAHRLTGSHRASWFAALCYAFLPFHWAQSAYHPHGAQTQWLPAYFLALWSCAERLTIRRLALLVVAVGLTGLSNFYYGLIAAVLTPLLLGGHWLLAVADRRPRLHGGPAATAVALVVLAAGGLLYIARWAPRVLTDRSSVAAPRGDLELYTADWWSYLVPPVDHLLAAGWVDGFWQRKGLGGLLEQQLTLGLGLLVLAAVAVFAWLARPAMAKTRAVPVLVATAALAFLVSMPPVWRLGQIEITAPSSWIFAVVPMFRALARFGLAVGLAVAVLGGIGFALLFEGTRRQRAVAIALAILAAVELAPFPPWRWRDVLPTTAHRWLAQQSGPLRLLDCVDTVDSAQASVGRLLGKDYSPLPPFADCGDPQAAAVFAARGFSHLLVRRSDALGQWLTDRQAAAGLKPVGDFEDALLFTIEAAVPPLRARFGPGFHWREYKGDASYRWMQQRGRLDIAKTTPADSGAEIELVLSAFPGPRQVDLRLDDAPIAELSITIEPTPYRVDLGSLAAGRYRLELAARAPAVVPDELLGNGDARELTVAIWGWRWPTPLPPGPDRSVP